MPVTIGWGEVAYRLGMTVIAGLVIGFNRGERGRPAGMRTTLLVCLAASIAMIQANLLMNTTGKASDSFIVMDLMRFPLGILSGMGFIGAGAILRKGDLVLGITTAATLWYVTVMGLCIGGGQVALGMAAMVIGITALWGLKQVENRLRHEMRGRLKIAVSDSSLTDGRLRELMAEHHIRIHSWGISYFREPKLREINCELEWRAPDDRHAPPSIIDRLQSEPAIVRLDWEPQGLSSSTAVA
jgi:putative Mg2+ transporter-C (MgtC) family protein